MKVSQTVSELETQTVGSTLGSSPLTKVHNSVKTVNVVTVYYLCTSSDDALYCTQFQDTISEGFRVIERMRFIY